MSDEKPWRILEAPGTEPKPVFYDGPSGCGKEWQPGIACGLKHGICFECWKAYEEEKAR